MSERRARTDGGCTPEKKYRNRVKDLFEKALPHCVDVFLRRLTNGRKLQEPDYTAGLAIGLPKMLDGDAQLHKLGLRMGGCYIHQKPYVTYEDKPKPKSCELGDLLVLCREMKKGKELINAVLLQMKMGNHKRDVDKKQLRLYVEWPKFWFKWDRQQNDKRVYDVYPKTVTQGALYSFVHPSKSSSEGDDLHFTVVSPNQCSALKHAEGIKGTTLQDFLADFVIGLTGRSIVTKEDQETAGDDWSAMIWQAVSQIRGNEKGICRSGILAGRPPEPRVQGDVLSFLNNAGLLDGLAGNESEEINDFVPHEGMGVLFISRMDDLEEGRMRRTKNSRERLKRTDVVNRLLKLGYRVGATSDEYKIVNPEDEVEHTVHLKKHKRSYTLADVEDLFSENSICAGCAARFWDDSLTPPELFIKMGLSKDCLEEYDRAHTQNSSTK